MHLIGLFYYTLANIRPHLRSTHKTIQLIACVMCNNLNKYGFDRILEPFIEDVNKLSQVGDMMLFNKITIVMHRKELS